MPFHFHCRGHYQASFRARKLVLSLHWRGEGDRKFFESWLKAGFCTPGFFSVMRGRSAGCGHAYILYFLEKGETRIRFLAPSNVYSHDGNNVCGSSHYMDSWPPTALYAKPLGIVSCIRGRDKASWKNKNGGTRKDVSGSSLLDSHHVSMCSLSICEGAIPK